MSPPLSATNVVFSKLLLLSLRAGDMTENEISSPLLSLMTLAALSNLNALPSGSRMPMPLVMYGA
eukprot:CAMPEP_0196737504 /NCGR_PEP_ID=MMETSP1091-20130531/15220_1 /TAXON_ID=302021 /ORGANISM="Rhodomonas sp., Strain CCMP768" /LENGTH=64 /DNA_ID=CAMNT_0042081359 /DNA_START=76 /DNA_END=267 /DNA_ORIENTATION=+